MNNNELCIGKNNIISTDEIKSGIKKEDIKDEKLLSIFQIYDNGNNILEENEINNLKKDLLNAASEDGDSTELSKKEAKQLIKQLGLNIKQKDLTAFLNKLVEISVNVKSCITDDESITTTKEIDGGTVVKEIYDLNGSLVRKEVSAQYKDIDGILIENSDGTIIFKGAQKHKLFGNIPVEYYFNNEKDFKDEKPAKVITKSGTPFQTTKEFTYDKNGRIVSITKKDADNNLLAEESYDKDGVKEQEKKYQNGKLKIIKDYENGVASREVEFFDKSETFGEDYNKTITKYDRNEKKDSKDFIRADGSILRHIEYNKDESIKYDVEYYPNGNKKCEITKDGNSIKTVTYNEDGTIINIRNTDLDGYFGHFRQGVGDCYLLASIESIKNTKNGQEYLSSLITKNSDGGCTVKLPGAQKAFKELRNKYKVPSNITGEYKFSADEIQSIISQGGKNYSSGDSDVILLEAAFEKYRKDVYRVINANPNIDLFDVEYEAGLDIITGRGIAPGSLLEGGHPADAIYILTGERSEVYENSNDPIVSEDRLKDYDTNTVTYSSVVVGGKNGVKSSKESLNKMLDKVMNDTSGNIVATASFNIDKPTDGHVLSIKKVTKDAVILVNPWDSSQTVTMSRKEFVSKVDIVTLSKMPSFTPHKPTQTPKQPIQNSPKEITPSKSKDKVELTPVSPKQQDELTPVKPKPSNDNRLVPAKDTPAITPAEPKDNELTRIKNESEILDEADGNAINRAKKSKLDYESYQNKGGLTRIISGQEFKDFAPADYRKLINDYSTGNANTKRTIEKIVHDKSNWEYAQEQDSTILSGLKLIYNNYDKYKHTG